MDGVAALHEDELMKATQPFGNSLMPFQDYAVVEKVIVRIKERLRTVPKLDILSQPFRISFVKIGNYRFETADIDRLLTGNVRLTVCVCGSLDVEVTCYFAVKSVDDFLVLQQVSDPLD